MKWSTRRKYSSTTLSEELQIELPELSCAGLFCCAVRFASGGSGGFCEGSVDGLIELSDVGDLGPAVWRDDEDGRGVAEADAHAKSVVGVDLFGELAGGIDDEGHLLSV